MKNTDETPQNNTPVNGALSCQRKGIDRRKNAERRSDTRRDGNKRSIIEWVKTLTKPRLGVDRRKGSDQRIFSRQDDLRLHSLLTPEEIEALLK